MNIVHLLTLASLSMLSVVARAGDQSDQAQIPVAIADHWLALLDSGKYNQSWGEAAPLLQTQVRAGQWRRLLRSVRDSLGEMQKRRFDKAKEDFQLPGVPAGDYVVVQFETSFSEKPDAIETVTLAKDQKQTWRLLDYYVN